MANTSDNLTPAMKQFHHFKDKYPDAVLFFRMGDFYETFYEDAQICSRVLGLALTTRNKNSANPIPLAGLPYHAVDAYLKKMIKAGYKVAVCEQVEDPKKAKGVVKRDVVRVITPGTLTDDILLDEKEDNFLCAPYLGPKGAALCWVDISTGHFYAQQLDEDAIVDEILRLSPSECLVPEKREQLFGDDYAKLAKQLSEISSIVITHRPGWYFDPYSAEKSLLKHFGTNTLEGFGVDGDSDVIPPAGALLEYLSETQKTSLAHIRSIKLINKRSFLHIDQTSLRSLEILRTMRSEDKKGSLFDSIDQTLTGMGARMLRGWVCMPLRQVDRITERHTAVQELCDFSQKLDDIRSQLKNTADLERIVSRISTFRASPKDFVLLADTLRKIPAMKLLLSESVSGLLKNLAQGCDTMEELADLLEAAIEPECPSHFRDGGVIRTGFNAELDELRGISKDGRSWLAAYQKKQIELTGIQNLKLGFNKVFGYYLEISRSMADQVPGDYVRKQTLKNAERYITQELKEYEDKVLSAHERSLELELSIFDQLRSRAAGYASRLQVLAQCVGCIDCIASLAHLALRRGYIRPEMCGEKVLEIKEGKHPVVAQSLGNEFVSNDLELGGESADVMIITGPNMSGKSTYIRQSALLVLMAQMGSFIPAESARIGVVDRIFTRVGASDELARGQSTFMVEMTETANIINNATDRSLVVLDEVGRGTSTYDGLSLAWAITEHIANNIGCRTLFATHYHELTELAQLLDNVKNCNVAVREWMDEVVFLHKIVPGGTDKSYGIHVARLAGLPASITARSREILDDLESTFVKEASGEKLARNKTAQQPQQQLFVEQNRSVLEKLLNLDVNNLTPIEAITLLNDIKKEIREN
ncbi:DNA mismatch repair protein MutS [Limihaloglobus sulfuriphilus]|uniref:DNA mismatch repair protein MutS n=1 Tax=Limihaloglobus sulfuriphilus TaxID=1851148 RepID=A0A1Q2MIJ7_9BACT|nr:DNA mismatch repair protein MutS [Limihaloglobus sulfuriphilus]AQQ72511.1 DNA mismatch repair protein MutS [Limihaloglobus sulfuriphilus]